MSRSAHNWPSSGADAPIGHLWSVAVWLCVWAVAAQLLGQPVLLPSPASVAVRFCSIAATGEFWTSIAHSLVRIALGFALACASGVLLAALSYAFKTVGILLDPLIGAVKAAPVASFIILVLVWVPSRNLSPVIAFTMGFPIMYTNVLEALRATDVGMLEMARVFRLSLGARIRSVYLSQVLPSFGAACSLALGFCWKSGIAAEVIGLPDHTIGDHLHDAKIYLDTPSLFAWTIAVIILSVLIEKVLRVLIAHAVEWVEARP